MYIYLEYLFGESPISPCLSLPRCCAQGSDIQSVALQLPIFASRAPNLRERREACGRSRGGKGESPLEVGGEPPCVGREEERRLRIASSLG